MNKDTEVFRQILELLNTLTEGLEYANSLIVSGNSDETVEMTYNILAGIESVVNALMPYTEQFDLSKTKMLEGHMYEKLNSFIDIIKVNNLTQLGNYIHDDIIPAFADWKSEIEKLLRPYTLS